VEEVETLEKKTKRNGRNENLGKEHFSFCLCRVKNVENDIKAVQPDETEIRIGEIFMEVKRA